ncbi:MAG: transcriptional repressor LexA [Firmicutes bacterium]|nr:transcriptional repressor LexA [Bacillota bacterium]
MGESLTRRQREILEFIKRRIRERGYPPSVREIGEAVGLSSSSTVHGHLARLEEKGYLRRDPSKPRAIEVLDTPEAPAPAPAPRVVPVPVVGRVAAGTPILAEENVEDVFPLPEDWVRGGEIFMLEVRGDSMIEAGILDGDRVIVRRQDTAENGDIVVALIGDEATVKRYYREADHIRLQPENSRMEPIRTREATIIGRVIGLVRLL